MEFIKSKVGIALIVSVLVIAAIFGYVWSSSKSDNNSEQNSSPGASVQESPGENQEEVSDPSEPAEPSSSWPSDWPSKPTEFDDPPKEDSKDEDHDHDPASEELDVPSLVDSGEEKDIISGYVDNEHHAHESEEAVDAAVFPDYRPRMKKFAAEYLNTNRDGKKWFSAIEPYVDTKYKELYEGAVPKEFGLPDKGEITLHDLGPNLSGKVQFNIIRGDEPVAKIIAQYQDDWRVIQIDAP